jgi:Xaa-Pro aminopeptidase
MLTPQDCRERRLTLWKLLDPPPESDHIRLADPLHLIYLANFYVNPFSLGAGFGGYLLLRRDGHATLIHDDMLPPNVEQAHVDERRVVDWYDSQAPAHGARQLAALERVNPGSGGLRFHDRAGDPYASILVNTIAQMRRRKFPDEIAVMRHCMAATEAGHAWARQNIRAGMTELDMYRGVASECTHAAGQPVIVYGDFAVCTGPERKGPPTQRVLEPGDMFILDFSVVINGYRSDFTNTLVVDREPSADQMGLYRACLAALKAGEVELRAGNGCKTVYDAVYTAFENLGTAQHFPHHAGHGLGLSHPEAPYLVRHATESLKENDIITLEPGLYVSGIGGIRIERNYLITAKGYECLSNHEIALR